MKFIIRLVYNKVVISYLMPYPPLVVGDDSLKALYCYLMWRPDITHKSAKYYSGGRIIDLIALISEILS